MNGHLLGYQFEIGHRIIGHLCFFDNSQKRWKLLSLSNQRRLPIDYVGSLLRNLKFHMSGSFHFSFIGQSHGNLTESRSDYYTFCKLVFF